ncbi:MAG TPA: NAD-dependent epimerase/dehydratase family protein, partial [Arcobacter sp.]|nr:NAD-dependent epimerase/dehydratase family protein [Arcobacter sp.]
DAISNDRAINVFNHGKMSRDFTYIDDIVDGIIKVIDNPSDFNVYNIGNNAPVSLMDFIETLENALGKEAEKNFMEMQPGDVESTYADTTPLVEDFGYKPDTELGDGIGEFVEWYRGFYG